MQLQCPACRAKILADDVHLASRMAKCRGCNNVFEFGAPERPPAEPAARPGRWRVSERPGELEISWRWFRPAQHLFLAFFCTAWDGFLVFWYSMAFKTGAPWIMKVFPIGHLAVGIGLTYATLTGFWNRTIVEVRGGRLRILHGPLPWRGSREIPIGELRRVTAAIRPNFSRNGASVWQLLATTRSGEELRLLASLEDETQAKYLEEKIGAFLC